MSSSLSRPVIFFGKVITSDLKKALRINIDKYKMDERLTMYFKEKEEVYAFNSTKIECDEGDYVIIRQIDEVPCDGEKIQYNIEKLVYKSGYFVDPLTGKRCAGSEYIDDINKTTELFGFKRSYQNNVQTSSSKDC